MARSVGQRLPVNPALVLTFGAISWAMALPAAAWAASVEPQSGPWARLVYDFCQTICHQRPERSFLWGAVPWPVCARCSGIYVGAALGACLGWMRPVSGSHSAARVRAWLLSSAVPAGASLLYEWSSGRVPSHEVRAVTGALLGLVTAAWLVIELRAEWGRASSNTGGSKAVR